MEPEELSQSDSNEEMILFDQNTKGNFATLAYPWYTQRTRKIEDPILRMHNQAIEFCIYISPTNSPQKIQLYEQVFRRVEQKLAAAAASVLSPFFKHKIYLKDTQLQIYVLIEELNTVKKQQIQSSLRELSVLVELQSSHLRYQTYEYQMQLSGVSCVFRLLESQHWGQYLALIDESLGSITEMKYLYMIVSCMIRQRWWHTNIRPYLVFGLLSVFFQQRRKQKTRILSENILKFLEYYGVGPFQERKISYLGKGRYQLFQEGQGSTQFSFWICGLNISNPFLKDLFGLLRNRYRVVANYNYDKEQSIIGGLVNPNGQQFTL